MDIHKPKPVHSWRELLSEVGVVVIGIIIALSGEQVVETLHHNEQRHELRQALDRDGRQAIDDSKKSIAFSESLAVWLIASIDHVRSARVTHHPLGAEISFRPSRFDIPTDPAFQAAMSSGRLSLLTPEEVAAYSEAHSMTENTKNAYERMFKANLALKMFRFKFRQQNGSVDLSQASTADVDRYFDLLVDLLGASGDCRANASAEWGLQEALLHGERNLPRLYRAERIRYTPLAAMSMN